MLARKALAGTAGTPKLYVEDVFSTYLYTGNGSTQTITNNIDLSGEGGLVWQKTRSLGSTEHILCDTARGVNAFLRSNLNNAEVNNGSTDAVYAFNNNGFSTGTTNGFNINLNGETTVSWTFRKAKKFFDIVTYTGDGNATQTISHNLGSAPGCIIVKSSSNASSWYVYHRSTGNDNVLFLNTTDASTSSTGSWATSSTNFTVGNANLNISSRTYVAYLFAHDAGGFGLTGSDNVISCGSWNPAGSGSPVINLGWEPQWILFKRSDSTGNWRIYDTMRGWLGSDAANNAYLLNPNLSDAETALSNTVFVNSTGFTSTGIGSTGTYIYIAIRRGPMKTPTTGTSVFDTDTRSGSASVAKTNSDILTDLTVIKRYTSAAEYWAWTPRLVGDLTLQSNSTDAELTGAMATNPWDTMTGAFCAASNGATNTSTLVDYSFRRAPGFFDVVCYTGNGANRTVSHNLGVAPELMIVKKRNAAETDWIVYSSNVGATKGLYLNQTDAEATNSLFWNDTTPTSSVFTLGTSGTVNASSATYVAYLFASLSGVSKIGTYTGNGSSVTVTTNFQPRFILVKRTDSTGNWIVSDSARGLVAGNDPYLLLNSTAAEDTDEDWVDVSSTSFTVNQTTASNANVNTGTYLYLAIA